MKEIYLVTMGVLWMLTSYGQQKEKPDSLKLKSYFSSPTLSPNDFSPKVVPPSPDAASLGRYGEFPVSMSKGTPSISIPLYKVESGGLSLPISLSYHASGVRVNDVSSSVGLSWSLMASGAITRSINSLSDENSGGYSGQTFPLESNFNEFTCFIGKLGALDGTSYDGSPDTYFYQFSEQSGKFMYANKARNSNTYFTNKVPVTIPYKPLKIDGVAGGSSFSITDMDGTIYLFGGTVNGKTSTEITYRNEAPTNFISTWYLSHIISANRIDTIAIEYTTPVFPTTPALWTTTLVKSVTNGTSTTYNYQKGVNYSAISTIYPAAIYFKNGKVTFNYSSDREDSDIAKRLRSVVIHYKNASGNFTELKRFTLSHSYFTATDGYSQTDQTGGIFTHTGSSFLKRLRFDKLTENSPTGSTCEIPSYKFTYDQTYALPIMGSYAQDYWGFYNGQSNNQKLLIYDTNYNGTAEPSALYGANRSPDVNYTKAGMLTKIQYPTGGYTVFDYEANQYTNGSTVVDGGGLRIKSITNFSENQQRSRKEYTYPVAYITNSIFSGNMAALAYRFSATEETNNGTNCSPNTVVTTSFPENYNFMLGSNSGSCMEYGKVEEYQKDSAARSLGKKVSSFLTAVDNTPSTFPFNTISNDWQRGQLSQEQYYAYQSNAYVLVKQVDNYYSTRYRDTLIRGYVARVRFKPLLGVYPGCTSVGTSYCSGSDISNQLSTIRHQFDYLALDYAVGTVFLDSTLTTTYSETGTDAIKENDKFEYAYGTHQQITKQTHKGSESDNWITLYRYAHEKQSGTNVYSQMVNRHIYSPVIEEEKQVNDSLYSLMRTNYKQWYATTTYGDVLGFIAPLSVEMQYRGGNFTPELVYGEKLESPTQNGYDVRANPIVYTTLSGQTTTLTWWAAHGKYDLLNTKNTHSILSETYDYYPLVGVKSMRNQNNFGYDYTYDALNRLSLIKDSSGNVVKSLVYHYTTNANCN